jgi:hypothetical protein
MHLYIIASQMAAAISAMHIQMMLMNLTDRTWPLREDNEFAIDIFNRQVRTWFHIFSFLPAGVILCFSKFAKQRLDNPLPFKKNQPRNPPWIRNKPLVSFDLQLNSCRGSQTQTELATFISFLGRTICSNGFVKDQPLLLNPTTSEIVSASFRIVTSTPAPAFIWDCIGVTAPVLIRNHHM